MPLICLQAGHENAKNNCDPVLARGTGAPGEVDFTIRTRNKLSEVLIQKGFQVELVDACFNCNPNADAKDYALFLAIHYDADVYKDPRDGGFIAIPDPSADMAHAESKRIQEAMISQYFDHSGIRNMPNRENANTKFYYMWKFLSAKTPCVLIECGVGKDPHDSVILADTDRVVNAIARGICKAFNVEFDPPAPPTPTPSPEPPVEPPQPPESPTPPELTPTPTPPPYVPPAGDYESLKATIKSILYGKGFWWTKLNKLKALLPK